MRAEPVYVIGPPRSGTTLLALLLAKADGVFSLSEPFQARAMFPDWFLKLFYWGFQKRAGLRCASFKHGSTREEYLDFLQRIAESNALRHLVIKEVFHEVGLQEPYRNLKLLDWIATREAPIIGIIRHPYDAIESTVRLLRFLLSGVTGVLVRRIWPTSPRFADSDDIVRWSAQNWTHFGAWTRQRNLFAVRYEDLVTASARTLHRICNVTGLRFRDQMLNPHHRPTAFAAGMGDPKIVFRRRRWIDTRSIGRGRRLTLRQQAIIRDLCGEEATFYQYTL